MRSPTIRWPRRYVTSSNRPQVTIDDSPRSVNLAKSWDPSQSALRGSACLVYRNQSAFWFLDPCLSTHIRRTIFVEAYLSNRIYLTEFIKPCPTATNLFHRTRRHRPMC